MEAGGELKEVGKGDSKRRKCFWKGLLSRRRFGCCTIVLRGLFVAFISARIMGPTA